MTSRLQDLSGLGPAELEAFVQDLGQPAFRGRQLFAWVHRAGVVDFADMTDLAKEFRALLARTARISRFASPLVERSADGSAKYAFTLEDGHLVEAVHIPEEDRSTLCVSTQVGCAMGCRFCLTSRLGLVRNLSAAEIVNQVRAVRDQLHAQGQPPLSNLVFMGMGEPLANLDAVVTALDILTAQRAYDFAARRITVSTCGLVPRMHEFGRRTEVNLAVSLHAADDATRSRIMPVNRTWPLESLLEACRGYPMKRRQRIMFEYTLLEGVNDRVEDARRLARILRGIPCKVNLLSLNEAPGIGFSSPPREVLLRFQEILRDHGYTVFIRRSRGADISAACGQLAGRAAHASVAGPARSSAGPACQPLDTPA